MVYAFKNIMKLERREWSGYDNKAGRMRKLGNVQRKLQKMIFQFALWTEAENSSIVGKIEIFLWSVVQVKTFFRKKIFWRRKFNKKIPKFLLKPQWTA